VQGTSNNYFNFYPGGFMIRLAPQLVIEKAWQHFILLNNPPAVGMYAGKMACRYRTPDGKQCAIGLFMSPELARNSEGASASAILPNISSIYVGGRDVYDTLQSELHDMLCSTSGSIRHIIHDKWMKSRRERQIAYKTLAKKINVQIKAITEPTLYTKEEADKLVAELSFGELDGWSYIANKDPDSDLYAVAVYDEMLEFVSFFNK
jgi:hypothetical protein